MSTFSDLELDERILEALDSEGYQTPTPVQAETIPALMSGRDVMGIAQTGTGKTAAFALPILHHLSGEQPGSGRPIRALMLTPTRELAAQIAERLRVYGRHLPLYSTVIFGGVGQSPQVKALRRGVDILVATPGRLLDLHNQGHVDLSCVEHFVLDEADRMLDMGFSKDVERILALVPKKRQNLMFSATMPKAIGTLAGRMLHRPVEVDISPEAPTTDRIEQYIAFVQKSDKRELLIDLIEGQMVSCGIVFTRTKHAANRLAKQLSKVGIPSDSIHGDKSQTARTKALASFKKGDVFVLVATDIASRGIDVEDITHVFNFDLPNEPEVYIHRIGRTARAGREGLAYSFCDETESGYLVGIQQLLGEEIEVLEDQPYHFEKARPKPGQKPGRVKGSPGGGRSRRGTGRGSGMRRYNRGGQKRGDGGNRSGGQRGGNRSGGQRGGNRRNDDRKSNNRSNRPGQKSDRPNRPSGGRPPQHNDRRGKQQGRSNASNRRSSNRSNRRQPRRDDR